MRKWSDVISHMFTFCIILVLAMDPNDITYTFTFQWDYDIIQGLKFLHLDCIGTNYGLYSPLSFSFLDMSQTFLFICTTFFYNQSFLPRLSFFRATTFLLSQPSSLHSQLHLVLSVSSFCTNSHHSCHTAFVQLCMLFYTTPFNYTVYGQPFCLTCLFNLGLGKFHGVMSNLYYLQSLGL